MKEKTLTAHLLSLKTTPPYSAATRHNFLTLAGRGRLPLSRLALWLAQCRVYAAHEYPRFLGALISRIPFHESDSINSVEEEFKQGILHVFVKLLDRIVLDVKSFKKTAVEFELDVHGWMIRKETRNYSAELAKVSLNSSLEEGIVFLWAMEQVSFYFVMTFGFY
jgi:thiaminase